MSMTDRRMRTPGPARAGAPTRARSSPRPGTTASRPRSSRGWRQHAANGSARSTRTARTTPATSWRPAGGARGSRRRHRVPVCARRPVDDACPRGSPTRAEPNKRLRRRLLGPRLPAPGAARSRPLRGNAPLPPLSSASPDTASSSAWSAIGCASPVAPSTGSTTGSGAGLADLFVVRRLVRRQVRYELRDGTGTDAPGVARLGFSDRPASRRASSSSGW